MKNFTKIALSGVACATIFLSGCGSDTDSDNNDNISVSGTIVDPYIVGAVLCEDKNKNATCDSGEQKSSISTAEGSFAFSNALTSGSHIIISTQGKHNGIVYDLELSGVVNTDGKIDVVSPITTLETRGLSKEQIITLLTDAGISGLSQTDITSDPMSGLSGKTSVTDAELKKLQTSLAVYGLLKIMKGSDTLNALTSMQLANSTEVQTIASSMVTAIKSSLNATTFNTIKSEMDTVRATANGINSQAGSYIPDVTTDVIIKTAVTVMDRIVEAGYNKCNETDGNITLALQEAMRTKDDVISQIADISQYYYGLENQDKFNNIPLAFSAVVSNLPSQVKLGKDNSTGILILNEENEFSTTDATRVNNLYGMIELNGGDLGDGVVNIARLDDEIVSLSITNEANATTTHNFTTSIIDINSTIIRDGKNKLSMISDNGLERYFYFYKGSYDSLDDNKSINGNTNYTFNNLRAGGTTASDMFVAIDNFNDVNTSNDNRWIYILPNNTGNISVNNLNASGGYRIDSINYEQYIVANSNGDNAGQDVNMSSTINVRKFNSAISISGTLKKIDTTTSGLAAPFSQSLDATDNNIWLHAHYKNTLATYNTTCNGSKCSNSESGNVWVGAQDMHLENGIEHDSATYNFTDGTYTINKLAQNTGYNLLAFWSVKNMMALQFDVNSTSDNDIVLQSLSKDINGTLANPATKVRIARVVQFSGEPNILYSEYVDKNTTTNIFTVNYQLDSSGTASYILWGDASADLVFTGNCDTNCTSITIGGDDDNSTNLVLP